MEAGVLIVPVPVPVCKLGDQGERAENHRMFTRNVSTLGMSEEFRARARARARLGIPTGPRGISIRTRHSQDVLRQIGQH